VGFTLHEGEILGLSGLEGQGQGALLFALFGAYAGLHGTLRLGGQPIQLRGPRDAMRAGIGMALVPEDRKTQGLILPMSLRSNVTLPTLAADTRAGLISPASEQRRAREMVQRLAIKTATIEIPVRHLSGGNQQKVAIAKWLLGNARVYLLHDPTRGIDVGTKQEIYALMRSLADSGIGLLFFSTDLSEIVNMCDRALVMYEGQIVQELSGAGLTEANLVSAALNLTAPANEDRG
jgi:ribose transport system ATP-binding protein